MKAFAFTQPYNVCVFTKEFRCKQRSKQKPLFGTQKVKMWKCTRQNKCNKTEQK